MPGSMRDQLPASLRYCALLALVVGACAEPAPARSSSPSARLAAPVGLFGAWVAVGGPGAGRDTLVLRADSTATGWNRRAGYYDIPVTRWRIKFRSSDPVAARADWLGVHYQDGGDRKCEFADDSTCVSLPVLCLGDDTAYECLGFKYRGDSLSLSNGARYARASVASSEGR